MTNLLDEVKRALEPFAAASELRHLNFGTEPDDRRVVGSITVGDFRRARSALAALEAAGSEEMVEKVARGIYEFSPMTELDFHEQTIGISGGSLTATVEWESYCDEFVDAANFIRSQARAALAAVGVK